MIAHNSVGQEFRQGSAGWFFCSTRPRQGSLSRISPLPPSLSRSPPHSLLQLELLFSMPLTPRSTEVDTAGILGVVPRTHTPSMSMFYGSKLSGPRCNYQVHLGLFMVGKEQFFHMLVHLEPGQRRPELSSGSKLWETLAQIPVPLLTN